MWWFFDFMLHLNCKEKGELLNFMVAPGDVYGRKPLENRRFIEMIYDKLMADKGYISKPLFLKLFVDGIQLITKLKSKMKWALMGVADRVLLRKSAIIESVNNELKNITQVEPQGTGFSATLPLACLEQLLLTATSLRNLPYKS